MGSTAHVAYSLETQFRQNWQLGFLARKGYQLSSADEQRGCLGSLLRGHGKNVVCQDLSCWLL